MATLTAKDARNITLKSGERFKETMEVIYREIKLAAEDGKFKVILSVQCTDPLYNKVKETLVLDGFKIHSFSSDIGNTAIHWN